VNALNKTGQGSLRKANEKEAKGVTHDSKAQRGKEERGVTNHFRGEISISLGKKNGSGLLAIAAEGGKGW